MPTAALSNPLAQLCDSSGFRGRNATASASAQLITLSPVAVLPSEACNQIIPQMTVVPSMVCGTSVGGGCEGDIGNPLVCNPQSTPVLEGLLTRFNNCGVILVVPEVYT
ncbi:kallikrein-14-like [Spodoptera litura]|uniref:Kallikrein-14-like n=1 Tax=Spodoptera litura TaxID=69820 RepID=A0A9J7IY07_SPOLT|nr:kallikrein-14-like [Spodoptera litura]